MYALKWEEDTTYKQQEVVTLGLNVIIYILYMCTPLIHVHVHALFFVHNVYMYMYIETSDSSIR